MPIPVLIVDDEMTDRMITMKRLSRSEKSDYFVPEREFVAGDEFLEAFKSPDGLGLISDMRPLILIDVNMPGRNGFETVEEMAREIDAGRSLESVVVMMFSSSENTLDIERAKSLDLVKGFIFKPFDDKDIDMILDWYEVGDDSKFQARAPG